MIYCRIIKAMSVRARLLKGILKVHEAENICYLWSPYTGHPALQLSIKLRPALLPGFKVLLLHIPALVPGLKVLLVHLPAPAPGGKIIGLGKAWLSRPFSSLQTAQCSSLTLLTNSSCSPLARPLPGTLIIREHRSNLSQ